MVHEIIIQAVRRGTLAVAGRRSQVLGNPPWFITELALETCNSPALAAARVGLGGKNIFTEPSQEFGVNLRANIGSPRIFGGSRSEEHTSELQSHSFISY